MSTSAPPTTGEPAFGYFWSSGIPEMLEGLVGLQGFAIKHGLPNTVPQQILNILRNVLRDVNRAAVQMAGLADGYIIAKIYESAARNRPQTGEMATHIKSEPGAYGSVSVALLSELDKIVNTGGYGPFWRAQEFGTGAEIDYGPEQGEVPTQVGRVLYGVFQPSGTAPDPAQRGLGAGSDLAFTSSKDPGAGLGTITEDLPGRHFLADGIGEAGAKYIAAMAAIQQTYVTELNELANQVVAEIRSRGSAGGTLRGVIKA